MYRFNRSIQYIQLTWHNKQNKNYSVKIMGVLQKFETGSMKKKMKPGCCTVSGDKDMQSINTTRASM